MQCVCSLGAGAWPLPGSLYKPLCSLPALCTRGRIHHLRKLHWQTLLLQACERMLWGRLLAPPHLLQIVYDLVVPGLAERQASSGPGMELILDTVMMVSGDTTCCMLAAHILDTYNHQWIASSLLYHCFKCCIVFDTLVCCKAYSTAPLQAPGPKQHCPVLIVHPPALLTVLPDGHGAHP